MLLKKRLGRVTSEDTLAGYYCGDSPRPGEGERGGNGGVFEEFESFTERLIQRNDDEASQTRSSNGEGERGGTGKGIPPSISLSYNDHLGPIRTCSTLQRKDGRKKNY